MKNQVKLYTKLKRVLYNQQLGHSQYTTHWVQSLYLKTSYQILIGLNYHLIQIFLFCRASHWSYNQIHKHTNSSISHHKSILWQWTW